MKRKLNSLHFRFQELFQQYLMGTIKELEFIELLTYFDSCDQVCVSKQGITEQFQQADLADVPKEQLSKLGQQLDQLIIGESPRQNKSKQTTLNRIAVLAFILALLAILVYFASSTSSSKKENHTFQVNH